MKLDEIIQNFRVAKIFQENSDRINAMDFSVEGETLISSSNDNSIVLYDCLQGTYKTTINCQKYGVEQIKFTHAANTIIHCSAKVDDKIRYLSLCDNVYIRYFSGHTNKVVTLNMSPKDDTFISASLDKTVRLWDLRAPNCLGLMQVPGRPVAAFDPEGLIFAAGFSSEYVKLYDLRLYEKGPFKTFRLLQEKDCEWTSLKFSPDGKIAIIATNGDVVRLIDSFLGTLLQTFVGHNSQRIPLEASFSPDSQFVFHGSSDGLIYVWNAITGIKVGNFRCDHTGPVQCVQFNPKYSLFASACKNMVFWLPSNKESSHEKYNIFKN